MDLTKFKREDFENLRHRRWDEDIGKFNSLIIIPNECVHDSGFQCMEFVALDKDNNPICKLGGGADVIHLDGIGGYGDRESVAWPRYLIESKAWSIDCLPCGYLRLFSRQSLTCGHDLSSFEIYAE